MPTLNQIGGSVATSLSSAAYPLAAPDGAVGAPSYAFATGATTGLYYGGSGSNTMRFVAGGNDIFQIDTGPSFKMASGVRIKWSSGAISASSDVFLARVASRSLKLGEADSATPSANTLTIGENSRSGTDTNVGGSSGTIKSGLGTGTGTASSVIVQTPTLAASGTDAQSYATRLTIATTDITPTVPLLAPDGSAAAPSYAFSSQSGTGFYYASSQIRGAISGVLYYQFASTSFQLADTTSNILLGGNADLMIRRVAAGRVKVTGANAGGLTLNVASTELTAVSGATVTATSLVPARAIVVGVATYVTTSLGTGGGTTGYTVGDGSDADRFGAVTGTVAGTDTDSSTDATADPRMTWSTSAANIVITAAGGAFNGTGAIRVIVSYLGDSAPTS